VNQRSAWPQARTIAPLPAPANQEPRTEQRAADVLAHHGRSFHWASRWLRRRHARDAAVLYAFCRRADDLVDELPPAEGHAEIAELRRQLADHRQPELLQPSDAIAPFVELMQRVAIDPEVVDVLLHTLQQDAGPVRMRSERDLLRYAYGVASTVGLMMCRVLECRDPRALAFAIDLGVAMQLTNVARDVLEDAGRDRIYLPLDPAIEPRHLLTGAGPARDAALHAVGAVLDVADRYYRSADRGLCYLPWRARAAILAASRIYEGIGAVIRGRGAGYWQQRCRVGLIGKLYHSTRAMSSLLFVPRYWRIGHQPTHDGTLHFPLSGLPHTEPA
jgi:15-cis-phytoene synthase